MSEKNVNKLFGELSKQLGMSGEQIKNAAADGNVSSILSKADPNDRRQAEEILSDPEKTRQILNSPQAQALIKNLNHKKQSD